MKDEELIWVNKDLAERWKKLTTEKAADDEKRAVFDEYIKKATDVVRSDFKASLESLEEDAAIFAGLMLKVKQAFGKAKDEHLEASYALWEKFEAEIPSVQKKTAAIINMLGPLKKELNEINDLLGKINTYDIDRLVSSIASISNTYGKQKEMIEFLISNFGK